METLNKNLFVDIPNTEEGREAIKTIRKYINRDLVKTIRLRGRGSRVKVAKKLGRNPRAFDQCLPLEHSERMTLYLDYNKKNPSSYNVEVLNDEIRNLKSEMKKLQRWRDFVWQKVPTEEIIEHINDNVDGISQWKQRTLKANIMDIVEGDLG